MNIFSLATFEKIFGYDPKDFMEDEKIKQKRAEKLHYALFVKKEQQEDSKQQRTPLMRAILNKDFEKARLLIKNGADVNAQDKRGLTPLMYLAVTDITNMTKNKLKQYLQVLRELFKNPNLMPLLKNKSKQTVMDLLSTRNQKVFEKYLSLWRTKVKNQIRDVSKKNLGDGTENLIMKFLGGNRCQGMTKSKKQCKNSKSCSYHKN